MSVASRRPRVSSLALLVLIAFAPSGQAASIFDPAFRFRVVRTEHFVVYVHQDADHLAGRLAAVAEAAWRFLADRHDTPPVPVHLVLVDQADSAGAWATPFPRNTIVVFASWPSGSEFIGHVDDWLRIALTHELAHIVHLDRSAGWSRVIRSVFGRIPLALPNTLLPVWQIEGFATYQESAATKVGRLYAGDFQAVTHEAARTRTFEPLDRLNGGLTAWPGALAPYVYGLGFHDYLVARYGEAPAAALADATARQPPYLAARAFRELFGRSLGDLWHDYEATQVAANGSPLTETPAARLTRTGFTTVGPRFAPVTCPACPAEIVYTLRTPHGFPSINLVRLDGTSRQLATRYLGATAGASPHVVVFDQQELQRNVSLFSDLFVLDRESGRVHRLTTGARLVDPDLAPDGRTIVCAREHAGRRELVRARLSADGRSLLSSETLTSQDGVQFNTPRWSPDGRLIAAERHRLGALSDLVVIDAKTGTITDIASDPQARIATPEWHPDGSAIVAAVARTGEPFDLFEFPLDGGVPRRLTRTSGGASWPAVSPDGTTIVYVGYTSDGFDLFSMPYPAGPDSAPDSPLLGGFTRPTAPGIPSALGLPGLGEPYSPWPTLRPTAWVPVLDGQGRLTRVGAETSGSDVLGYHHYTARAAWIVNGPRDVGAAPDWRLSYACARWQPTVFASAARTTASTVVRVSDPSDGADTLVASALTEHQLEGGLLLPIRSVRVSHQGLISWLRSAEDYGIGIAERRRTAVRLGWATSTAKRYGYSLGPEHGVTVGATAEFAREARTSRRAATITADARSYLPGFGPHAALALRVAAGGSWGDRDAGRTFVLGGSASNLGVLDFGRGALSLLRGFSPDSFAGERTVVMNADYRWPLARPERGVGTWPIFLHTVHAAVFADAGHAWTRRFAIGDAKTALGAEVSADLVAGYGYPLTVTAGAAWGRDGAIDRDRATLFVRVGRAF